MSSWTARISRRRSATGSGSPAFEGVDREGRLRAGLGDGEGDAALDGELTQVALLAGRRRQSRGLDGRVAIGHGRAWARRAGPSSPGPSGLAKRPARQGLTVPRARRAWLANRTERRPLARHHR